MNQPEFRFESYAVGEDVRDETELRELANRLTDDLIVFIANELGQKAPSRKELLTNREQLLSYIGHYDRLVADGRIVLPSDETLMPCGDTPNAVIDVYRNRAQMGLDGILLTVPGVENLEPEVLEAMSTLPKVRLELILKLGTPADYSEPVITAFGALSDVQFQVIVKSFEGTSRKLSDVKVDVLNVIAKLKDEVIENLQFTWCMIGCEPKRAAVLEEIAKIDIPVDLLQMFDFNCAKPHEVQLIGKLMNPMKWAKVREARARKVPVGKEAEFRQTHWTIASIAALSDEQLEAFGNIDSIFVGNLHQNYDGVFNDISASQFPAKNINSIGGDRLNFMFDLTEPNNEGETSLVYELGRLSDEDIKAYGGIDHILNIALGQPLSNVERDALVAEIDELLNAHPEGKDITGIMNNRVSYTPNADLLNLRNSIANSGDLRIGDHAPLYSSLKKAFAKSHNERYVLFNNEETEHFRLAAFCAQILPEAKDLARFLKSDRELKEPRSVLKSRHDRSIMDPNSSNYPIMYRDRLIRKPVHTRINAIQDEQIGSDDVSFFSEWPLSRDSLLDTLTDEQLLSASRTNFLYYLKDHKITDSTIQAILESREPNFHEWFPTKVNSFDEAFFEMLYAGDVDGLLNVFRREQSKARLVSRLRVGISLD